VENCIVRHMQVWKRLKFELLCLQLQLLNQFFKIGLYLMINPTIQIRFKNILTLKTGLLFPNKSNMIRLRAHTIFLFIGILALSACASNSNNIALESDNNVNQDYLAVNDPYENVNRGVFAFNQAVDGALFRPIAEVYSLVPKWGRDRVSNALDNLGEPINFTNNLLQGETERAGSTLMRFVINSTFGIVGLFDVAEEWGIEYVPEDFGQTASIWGVDEGPYIVWPLLGPSNPRDSLGLVVDWLIDPMGFILTKDQSIARMVGNGIDQRTAYMDELDTLQQTSVDFYATMRESYRQYRNAEIRNSELPELIPIPSMTIDETEETPSPADDIDQIATSGN